MFERFVHRIQNARWFRKVVKVSYVSYQTDSLGRRFSIGFAYFIRNRWWFCMYLTELLIDNSKLQRFFTFSPKPVMVPYTSKVFSTFYAKWVIHLQRIYYFHNSLAELCITLFSSNIFRWDRTIEYLVLFLLKITFRSYWLLVLAQNWLQLFL